MLRRGFVDDERTAQMREDGGLNLSVVPYVDEKIEPYLCGADAEARGIADDIEMFVHAPYSVEMQQPRHSQ